MSLEPTDGIYVGYTSDSLPYDLDDADRWADEVTEPQIVHWYQQWGSGESRFRGDWLAEVAADGRIPMVSWEAWAKPDGSFHQAEQELGNMADIADGPLRRLHRHVGPGPPPSTATRSCCDRSTR